MVPVAAAKVAAAQSVSVVVDSARFQGIKGFGLKEARPANLMFSSPECGSAVPLHAVLSVALWLCKAIPCSNSSQAMCCPDCKSPFYL